MKTKVWKRMLTTLMAGLMVSFGYGQGLYLGINGGYNWALGTGTCPDWYNSSFTWEMDEDSYTAHSRAEAVKYSLGEGIQMGGNVGFMINRHIGLELGLVYLWGAPQSIENTYEFTEIYYEVALHEKLVNTVSMQAQMLSLRPALVLSPGFARVNPYARLGAVISRGTISLEKESLITEQDWESGLLTDTHNGTTTKMDGSLAWGMEAGLGLDVGITSWLSAYGEVSMVNMAYSPTHSKITKAYWGEEDLLPDMTVREREVNYVDELEIHSTYPNPVEPDPDEPSEELAQSYPFSRIGLNLGFRFRF